MASLLCLCVAQELRVLVLEVPFGEKGVKFTRTFQTTRWDSDWDAVKGRKVKYLQILVIQTLNLFNFHMVAAKLLILNPNSHTCQSAVPLSSY